MKKTLLATTLATFTLLCASSAFAADGTLNFTGDIKDTTCVVDFGAGATSLSIPMGTFNKTAFSKGAGATSNATKFTIKLTTCPAAYTKATVEFDGTADTNNSKVLALSSGTTAAPSATGVGIQISDISGTVMALKDESTSYPLLAGTNINSLGFTARYVATAAAVTSGKADATANFTVKYN
jgi:major type 1 subunit fimbrin (pilin)